MSPSEVRHVAVLGGGLIGRSWTALFLAAGMSVTVYDPDPATEARVKETVDSAWPVLTSLGLVRGHRGDLVICDDPGGPSREPTSSRRAFRNVSS